MLICAGIALMAAADLNAAPQKFRHVENPRAAARRIYNTGQNRTLRRPASAVEVRDEPANTVQLTAEEILDTITPEMKPSGFTYAALLGPRVMTGYKRFRVPRIRVPQFDFRIPTIVEKPDSAEAEPEEQPLWMATVEEEPAAPAVDLTRPEWLRRMSDEVNMTSAVIRDVMVANPGMIDCLEDELPERYVYPEDDPGFLAFLDRLGIPKVDTAKAEIDIPEIDKRHWLHVFNAGLHFSQAYISPNWYQGGNNYLALLINFLWDVSLNQVYHPNLMFQNTVSYKLGLNSNPSEQLHRYSISEDIFQWNMKAGFKAFKKWFYSLTAQFKTQFLTNYEKDSWAKKASFLSPSDLNLGLGMTYSTTNKKNTLKFNASISPISYNLRTCIDRKIDPALFNIPDGKRYHNEIGSNAEVTMEWKWASNIVYRTRLFLFTNYDYFQGDWENTISFNINRFLSTQVYVHARYDTSTEDNHRKWKHFMLKEILSFGFSYSFSSK